MRKAWGRTSGRAFAPFGRRTIERVYGPARSILPGAKIVIWTACRKNFLSSIAPETYTLEAALQARPGVGDAHLDLLYDYQTNTALYPHFQKYLRDSQVPLLAAWGKYDRGFIPAGATAFKQDLPEARVELLETAHFALETHVDEIAKLTLQFFGDVLKTGR